MLYRRVLLIVCVGLVISTGIAFADSLGGGASLIILMQKASFWIGIGVAIWGIVEMQLDYPGWKSRVIKGILGYVAILILPLVFLEIKEALFDNTWQNIINKFGGF